MTAVAAHVQRARAAWPTLVFDERAYRAWLTADDTALAAAEAGEVLLCWAAACQDPEALRLFETHFISQIPTALRRFGSDAAFVDEVAQRVRVKLLVAPAVELAPIARYAFGGGLGGLVRVAAIREALTLRRGNSDRANDGGVPLEALVGEADPELRSLKERYAREFQRAFTAALAELAPRERQLLRLNLSAGASIDDIARMYQTHRTTAARWLNAARDRLAEATRGQLASSLGIAETELQSLMRLIRTEAPRLLESIPADRDDD